MNELRRIVSQEGLFDIAFGIQAYSMLYLYLVSFLLIFSGGIYYLSKSTSVLKHFKSSSSFRILRFWIIFTILFTFIYHVCLLYMYIKYWYWSRICLYTRFDAIGNGSGSHMYYGLFYPIVDSCVACVSVDNRYLYGIFKIDYFNINITRDFFGLILLTLAYIVGYISILTLDTKLYWKNIKYYFAFNIFLLIVIFYTIVDNVVTFFIAYECLLVPSFFFVYFVSPSRRAIQASLYFVIWTQVGSFLVLCAIVYMLSISNCFTFDSIRMFRFTNEEVWVIYILLFLGFGFKVPIWPFHYWLTKTHVEAASGFSIYLSGFLVKSALYGFFKLTNVLCGDFDTSIFITLTMLGVIDASLKMWGQTDLKKLVAYGTIQEMNLIFLVFCWGDTDAVAGGILFTSTHAFLSALMFFIVDCIYRRFHTRSIIEINGLLHLTPNLAISILFMCIFFSGLPGTVKFIVEFYIFNGFLEISSFSCFFLMFVANVLGLIGFSKCWFNVVFGMFRKNIEAIPFDLTQKEILIIIYCLGFLLFFSFFFNFLT